MSTFTRTTGSKFDIIMEMEVKNLDKDNFSVWKRIYSVEPHNATWHEFILADENDDIIGKIRTLESPPGSGNCWIESLSNGAAGVPNSLRLRWKTHGTRATAASTANWNLTIVQRWRS